MNSTGYEEDLFATEAERIIASHGQQLRSGATTAPMFLYYAMHLFHSPLCAPPELLEEFSFIDNEHRRYSLFLQLSSLCVCLFCEAQTRLCQRKFHIDGGGVGSYCCV